MASSIIDDIVLAGFEPESLNVFPISLGKSFTVDIGKPTTLAQIPPTITIKNDGISTYVAKPAPPEIIPRPIAAKAPTRPIIVAISILIIPLFFLY